MRDLPAPSASRALATRETDGLHVRLLWDPLVIAMSIEVEDMRAADCIHLAVARDRALNAFYHPLAYAA